MPVKNAVRTERRKGDAVTIHEVARYAGVSPMTVSRVMNSNSNVREVTRELVMRAVRELNYTPNAAARSLAAAQGTRIALIYTNPSAAYLSELLVGALAGAARTTAQLVLDTWDHMSHPAERAAARKIAQSVAGVILPPPLCESKVVLSELAAADIPVMAIASGRFQPDLSSVRIDDFRASQEMTEHLIAVGHGRIAFIRGHPNQTASALRYDGFHATMTAAGLTIDPALIQQERSAPKCHREAIVSCVGTKLLIAVFVQTRLSAEWLRRNLRGHETSLSDSPCNVDRVVLCWPRPS